MTNTHSGGSAAELRARLGHPVIDADGHFQELFPVVKEYFLDYAKRAGGKRLADRFRNTPGLVFADRSAQWEQLSWAERRKAFAGRPTWRPPFERPLDMATAFLPRLLNERLDEMGLDFAVLYPTQTLLLSEFPDDELRRVACRASNTMKAEVFAEFSDRMTPAAAIPMHSPHEAIEELEHAVNTLKLKAVYIMGSVRRPAGSLSTEDRELALLARRNDSFALESDLDYDPFWRKCVELGVSVASHGSDQGWGNRQSITSYAYNHIGGFSANAEALCKALFMGGVTRRFPTLNFAFLEGGVGWACTLYADLVGHWRKRRIEEIRRLTDLKLDVPLLERLVQRYVEPEQRTLALETLVKPHLTIRTQLSSDLDEFAALGAQRAEEIRDLFAPRFYFGCEADDPMVSLAFERKLLGTRFNAMFGSDIGHWDVTDMSRVLLEAYELVEDGLLTEADFRAYTFANVVRFYTGTNPDFFKGTRVERQVAELLRDEACETPA